MSHSLTPSNQGLSGQFTFWLPDGRMFKRPNIIPDDGEAEYLKMIVQADRALIDLGADFFVGLTSGVFSGSSILSDATVNEPTVAVGYARKAITRDATGWPVVDSVNGIGRAQSITVTFTASGGNFDKTFTRAFLTEASAGSTGKLLGVSAALQTPVQVNDTESFAMKYELFLRGTP